VQKIDADNQWIITVCKSTYLHYRAIVHMKNQQCLNQFKILMICIMSLSLFGKIDAANAIDSTASTRSDGTGIALSIYQHNLALIKDTRNIALANGHNRLIWQEIATEIKPETAWLRRLKHPEQLRILGQHFDLKRLTPQSLLESHIGEAITVIRTNPVNGEEIREPATVLSINDGAILQYADRIETGIPGRIAFSTIPTNLHDKPALYISLDNMTKNHSSHDLELTYLTQGLAWRADYVLELDQDERQASLIGFAALTNQSGIDFQHAKVQLIAGDINQINTVRTPAAKRLSREVEMVSAAAYADIETEPHFELHRYILPEAITLSNDQTRQISFMTSRGIPVKKQFVLPGQSHYFSSYYYSPEQKQAIDVYISFQNTGNSLGKPLPQGIVRAYKLDQQGDVHFVGEDSIQHTANLSTVRLKLGRAFDVSAEKKQTDFKRIPTPDNAVRQFETAHQITLHNTKKETVTVIVREPIPGDWQIISESQSHEKISAHLAEWHIEIPAESQVKLDYRVRTVL